MAARGAHTLSARSPTRSDVRRTGAGDTQAHSALKGLNWPNLPIRLRERDLIGGAVSSLLVCGQRALAGLLNEVELPKSALSRQAASIGSSRRQARRQD
jgi:hypothetical protein